MKAALLAQVEELGIVDLPVPAPGHGEALVRVKMAGVCGTDLHVYHGHHRTARLPVVLGHEFAGELVEINGECRAPLHAGSDVLVQPYYACGSCGPCVQGRDNVCSRLSILGVHRNGCFAEYVVVPLRKVYPKPANISLQLSTLAEPLAVAVHDVRMSGLQVGQTAFVIGGGPIGVLIALVARLSGAAKVVISEVNPYRIRLAQEMGFTVINPRETDIIREALLEPGGCGYDVVYEVSGTRQGAEIMTQLAKIAGTIVIVGVPTEKYPIDTGGILAKELRIVGVRIHAQLNFMDSLAILESGVLNADLAKFIDKVFCLEAIEDAFRYSIEDQEHFKVLVSMPELRH